MANRIPKLVVLLLFAFGCFAAPSSKRKPMEEKKVLVAKNAERVSTKN